jgi:hypothetical protein
LAQVEGGLVSEVLDYLGGALAGLAKLAGTVICAGTNSCEGAKITVNIGK